MLVKFFNTGKGSARHAFDYLLNNERVKNGTAKLVKGNPDVITFLTEQRMKEPSYRGGALYTSGVLSFSPEESKSLTDSNLGAIIGRFEATIFPKLDITRFNIAWVLHKDKDRTELHFGIQNFDLETKKAFTPFVADRDLSRVNQFKDKVNADFNLSDPNLVKSHYHVKGLKRLSEEQKSFYRELNKAYAQYVEERENPSFIKQAKGILSKIMGQNEPQAHDLHSNEDKYAFLQKFITERFKGLKINRSSDKYASVDFNGSKMRLFYEKFVVKELDDAFKIKVEQNKEKGLLPVDSGPIFAELLQSYRQAIQQAKAEKERLKRAEEEAEKERLRLVALEKQKELENKFRAILNGSKDVFIEKVIKKVIDQDYKTRCNELLEPTWMGTNKIHNFICYSKELSSDDLNAEMNKIKQAVEQEFGKTRLDELEVKGFFNLQSAISKLETMQETTLVKLKDVYIDFYKKVDTARFNKFKAEVDEYKSTHRSNAVMLEYRDYATAFLNDLLPRMERSLTVSNPSVEAEKTSVYQPQPQAKPIAPKFRM
uniref:Mobilization protein A n=1 Tax=Actinobacillus pleuropneumoniae TaxID=715 RepID=B3GPN6_ACTPL|nr:relaxase/mobilization nuclease domain-containing protein [Actinobacillus pleuropneumoniae]ACD76090.1 mobilization protein A [Actinobacillus pleuropneumoniae]